MRKYKCLSYIPFFIFLFSIVSTDVFSSSGDDQYGNKPEAVYIPLPKSYASDEWLKNGGGRWSEELKRRDDELDAYIIDKDAGRAKQYGFKNGHTPDLAWKYFDQHPIGYGGVPYVLLQTILSLDPATEKNPYLLAISKIWKKNQSLRMSQKRTCIH